MTRAALLHVAADTWSALVACLMLAAAWALVAASVYGGIWLIAHCAPEITADIPDDNDESAEGRL